MFSEKRVVLKNMGGVVPPFLYAILEKQMDEPQLRTSMQKVLENLTRELSGIRTGRASASLVSDVMVTVYGGTQHLRVMETASITVPEPTQILIEPWDKSIIGEIRQGILAANIGLNPTIDTDKLRISLPPLTTEDREKYVKLLHVKLEESRVSMRQSRGDTMQKIKKAFEAKEITEDDKFADEKKTQEITDEFIKKIEEMGDKKTEELRTV